MGTNHAMKDFNTSLELGYDDLCVFSARAMTFRALEEYESAARDMLNALETDQ